MDEDDAIALLAQRLARLRARIIELARLADDDRPRADDEDGGDVGAFGHYSITGWRTTRTLFRSHHWLRHLRRSEEHTSELQSLMRISYAVFCLKKQKVMK